MIAVRHFLGLDLGPVQGYTALAVLERPRFHSRPGIDVRRPVYRLRHLRRYPPGTPYPVMAHSVRQLLNTPPLPGAVIGIDQTGVGRAILNLFREALQDCTTGCFVPVTVTGSGDSAGGAVGLSVPRRELVGTMQALLQTRRLQIAGSLPDAPILIQELESFRAAPPVLRGESVELWRERDHDDLVLAVAIAAWLGELTLGSSRTRRRA